MWKDSRCKGPWLHRFKLRRSHPAAQEEVCDICHLRMFFMIRNGRVNNYSYLSWHLRSALQPWQARFKKEYANFQ